LWLPDGAHLAVAACDGLFTAEAFERALALHEIKMWITAASAAQPRQRQQQQQQQQPGADGGGVCSGDVLLGGDGGGGVTGGSGGSSSGSSGSSSSSAAENGTPLLQALARLLLRRLDDGESFVFLRVVDVLVALARRTRLGPVLRLALAQFADRGSDVGLRAKTAQVRVGGAGRCHVMRCVALLQGK
jgi:hypothetical protein